ncbi:MAG: class I SAM-dependent methyltransferase, partial [Oxalobacteraceae bacterium]
MKCELLNRDTISAYLTHEAEWQWSHGAGTDYLGMGLLYYAMVYLLKARVAVCLGSGGGFVPRLMRQAQRDIGIAETSRTILVDGNNPSAGWGMPQWLADESFFRKHFPDVEIVVDLTRSAAIGIFEKQNITIDYLHIDADHSFAACLEDFEIYSRFLREGSIVTLHDTNFSGAGVKHVIEHIRTLSACDVVDFPDIGEGTAVVRIGKPSSHLRSSPAGIVQGEADKRIRVTRHTDAPPLAPEGKEWKYLESSAFASRYVLAAHWVGQCRSVIEIGGSRTPIDDYLTGDHSSVLVLDPFIREHRKATLRGKPCDVSHVRARFQDVDWYIPPGTDYGLVMLGLEIQGMNEYQHRILYQLVDGAKVTVIEFPPSWT